ncbi:MAG: IS4 family transposase [Thiohalorhabdaceae bacterium]
MGPGFRGPTPKQLNTDGRDLGPKESGKWFVSHQRAGELQGQLDGTRVVSVADREGDCFELLADAQQAGAADILVRAQHARKLAGGGRLMDHLDAQPQQGEIERHVPARGNQPARTARMAVRFDRVTVTPPTGKGNLAPVTLDAVRTTEIDPPAGIRPLAWTLLTTVATETVAEAQERIQWYTARWQIEVYHRTFKSGCRVEDRQLGHADRLEACLAIDLIVGWRVFWLTKWAR